MLTCGQAKDEGLHWQRWGDITALKDALLLGVVVMDEKRPGWTQPTRGDQCALEKSFQQKLPTWNLELDCPCYILASPLSTYLTVIP